MSKKIFLVFTFFIAFSYGTFSQIDTLKIKTDSTLYNLVKGASLQLLLFVDNISSQKIQIKGLENLKIDSILSVYPYAETFFSANNRDFNDFGCKVDFDPIAWNYRKFHNTKFILKAGIFSDCLELIGYFKVRLHLYYQIIDTGEYKLTLSNWFIVKVSQ